MGQVAVRQSESRLAALTADVKSGRRLGKGPDMTAANALERPRRGDGRWIAGVCAGLADRFGISRFLVRLGFVIFGVVGVGELAYLVLWIVMPRARR